jgi:hypothetical protein
MFYAYFPHQKLKNMADLDKTMPSSIIFDCEIQCRGRLKPFSRQCLRCVKNRREKLVAMDVERPFVPVVGAGIHIYSSKNHSVAATIQEFGLLANSSSENIIFNSMPSYYEKLVPEAYRKRTTSANQIYRHWLPELHHYDGSTMRFLDFYQPTNACKWKNCSVDGGHRSRFVNRWKAQLLLNTLCTYS